jgi:hypothetical protein
MSLYCAAMRSLGMTDPNPLCAKHKQCALYRLWWETPGTDMHLCLTEKLERFVPITLEPAAPQPIQSIPIGQTLELFA